MNLGQILFSILGACFVLMFIWALIRPLLIEWEERRIRRSAAAHPPHSAGGGVQSASDTSSMDYGGGDYGGGDS